MSDLEDQVSEGGTGAPTSGSGGLSVPLGVYFEALRQADLRFDGERDRRVTERFACMAEIERVHREASKEAIEKALDSAKELADKHNDLIRAGEKKDETYATKDEINAVVVQRVDRLEKWQARLTGVALVISVIGIANFVKLWTG